MAKLNDKALKISKVLIITQIVTAVLLAVLAYGFYGLQQQLDSSERMASDNNKILQAQIISLRDCINEQNTQCINSFEKANLDLDY